MDLAGQLKRQIDFIKASCAAYDAGNHDEAIRIAVSLRVLFHDTKNSKSLLTQMKAVGVTILSTVPDLPDNAVLFHGMGQIRLGPTEASVEPAMPPVLPTRFLRRYYWWKQTVYQHQTRLKPQPEFLQIARKDVILGAANKDGGAHVDPNVEPEYKALTQGVWARRVRGPNGHVVTTPLTDAQLPYLRQMGYEVLNSPDLLTLAADT